MPIGPMMLRTAEAAAVSGVSLRDVDRAIDEAILPAEFASLDNGRRVRPEACTVISFYFSTARSLTAEERLHVIREAAPRLRATPEPGPSENWTVHHGVLTIDLGPFVERTAKCLRRLDAARALVEISPEILSGTPVVRGTRIPVHDIAASLAAGHTIERLLAAYPSLDAEKIELADFYAQANPLRGRPRGVAELPKGAVIVTDRQVARRRLRS